MADLLRVLAFIGFEDIVNMAEETRDPERTVPRAVLIALGLASALYLLVALAVVLQLPAADLAGTEAPLALLLARHGPGTEMLITVISLAAILNGALVQIVMASRVLYGMAGQGNAPRVLGEVDRRRRTPLRATVLVTLAVLVLALSLRLVNLAVLTSTVTLLVFTLVNLALWRLQRREPPPVRGFRCPAWVPPAGAAACLAFLTLQWAARWIGPG